MGLKSAEHRYSHPVDRASSLSCDRTVSGYYSHKEFPVPLLRIKYIDPKTRKRLVFLTNHPLGKPQGQLRIGDEPFNIIASAAIANPSLDVTPFSIVKS